jgi:hypothetical protein
MIPLRTHGSERPKLDCSSDFAVSQYGNRMVPRASFSLDATLACSHLIWNLLLAIGLVAAWRYDLAPFYYVAIKPFVSELGHKKSYQTSLRQLSGKRGGLNGSTQH